MISSIISRLVILLFGTLYPAYASYKAVRTKDIKEYFKWMMYWIVFALFTCAETFTDVFFSWFPFYYEIKIVIVLWLLSPATKGSSILYKKFVHPMLCKREQEIDEYIAKAKEQSYKQVLDIGAKGVNVLMQTAIKSGGGIVNQLRKSYSLSDLSDSGQDEIDVLGGSYLASRHGSSSSTSLYFREIDTESTRINQIHSMEDISSGYSSGDLRVGVSAEKIQARPAIARAESLRNTRSRSTRSGATSKRSISDESHEVLEGNVFDQNMIYLNDHRQVIENLQAPESECSTSEGEYLDTMDKLHDRHIDYISSTCKSNELTACLQSPKKNSQSECEEMVEARKNRGGKYNKRTAPKPPKDEKTDGDSTQALKAILCLKPGVIKSLPSNTEHKDIFIQSPTLKRKHNNKIPFISKIKFDQFSKIMNVSKKPKADFLQVPESVECLKRTSWHSLFPSNVDISSISKIHSKSDSNLVCDNTYAVPISRKKKGGTSSSPTISRRMQILKIINPKHQS